MAGAAQQQQLQMQGAAALQGMQFQGAQNLQNLQFQGATQAQQLGIAQQNLIAQGQGAIDMSIAEGAAGVQAAEFGQLGTILGMEMGQMAGLQGAYQGAVGNQMSGMGMQSEMYGSQASGTMNLIGDVVGAAATVGAAKLSVGACIAKGICIDTINGSIPIESINVGDSVIGYDGKPTSVIQKHAYKEDPKNTFYDIQIDYNGKTRTVNVGGWHKIMNVPAPEIKENVISKKEYNGVEFSYDLLTEGMGYRMNGVPVNSMIPDMALLIADKIKE